VLAMANLKGSSFEKQLRDAHFRTAKFGESRHTSETQHQTHSSALADKREEYGRSFAEWATNNGLDGKLNEHMTNENVKEFIESRTSDLSAVSSENYARGFGSYLEGLKESNIDMSFDKSSLNDFVAEAKAEATNDITTGRAIENVDTVIDNLHDKSFGSGVLAEIQNELGLRVSEAHELAQNPQTYINHQDNTVEGLVGKGNHEYMPKEISAELISKIESIEELPALRTYQEHLSEQNITSHDFRYTYANREMEDKLMRGTEHNQALAEVSQELNHNREDITNYYLARA
jgi:hypothetical protein